MNIRRRRHLAACITSLLLPLGCNDADSSSPTPGSPLATANRVAEANAASAAVSHRLDEIFQAIGAGHVERAYEELTTSEFREVASLDQFRALCDRVTTRLGRLQTKELSRFDVAPLGEALVSSATYQATFEHGPGVVVVVLQRIDDKWLLRRLNVNAPQLLDDPSAFRQPTEVHVEDSQLVMPGATVDLLDASDDPPQVLVENVPVLHVRWKVDDPSTPPTAPASGFITVGLKSEEVDTIQQAGTLSVRGH